MSKVVILSLTRFNRRDYNRYGIEILQESGYEPEVWELTPFLDEEFFESYTPPDLFSYDGHTILARESDILEKIKELTSNDVVVSFIGPNCRVQFIYDYLYSHDILFGIPELGLIPRTDIGRLGFLERLRKSLSAGTFIKDLLRKLKSYLPAPGENCEIPPAGFLIAGGEKAVEYCNFPMDEHTSVIGAHAFDYDRYLERTKNNDAGREGEEYAVFLDEFLPYHPDFLRTSQPPPDAAETYFDNINKFFDRFEEETGIKVVVCAHPRATYSDEFNPFKGRPIRSGDTIDEIRNATCVLGHASTAYNFAVIYQKPTAMLYHSRYSAKFVAAVKQRARYLGNRAIDISGYNPSQINDIFSIDRESYDNYFNDFIKAEGTPEKFIWEIFVDYLENEIKQRL